LSEAMLLRRNSMQSKVADSEIGRLASPDFYPSGTWAIIR
jgi:hypothetical protein